MKLSTYNFLTSRAIKGVKLGYPLTLNVAQLETCETDYNRTFMENLLVKLDWKTVLYSASVVNLTEGLPEDVPNNSMPDFDDVLRKLHHLLLEVDIKEGTLTCPETGREFVITNSVANLLLNEDEV